MRSLNIIAALCFSSLAIAQITGNKNIVSKSINVNNITEVKINLHAKITVDCNMDNSLVVKTDSNLFEQINAEVVDGVLHLYQKEWIKASSKIEVTIGAPNLTIIEIGTHDVTYVKNFKKDSLKIIAPLGSLIVSGTTNYLEINAKNGNIDASKLVAQNADVTITGRSKIEVDVVNELKTDLSDNAIIELIREPKIILGDMLSFEKSTVTDNNIKWIKFKLRNNSIYRPKLFVIGPKKDGTTFSYGFAMMPFASREERWTTGTKIYTNPTFGSKKLLVIISEDHMNEVVELFD